MTKRKGSNSRDAIDSAILERLNLGLEESATLSEALAVDFSILLEHVAPNVAPKDRQSVADAHGLGITKRMSLVATVLAKHFDKSSVSDLHYHQSDTVRGWAAFMIAQDNELSLSQKLSAVHALADDPHFGVREWAWLALRPEIAANIQQVIKELEPWVMSESENIRRFAIEATRPRGVWSKHILELKKSPAMAENLLNGVMEDSSKYVRDSCGNWLNDAAKSQPLWVIEFCKAWQDKSTSTATDYIIKRGLRNIA